MCDAWVLYWEPQLLSDDNRFWSVGAWVLATLALFKGLRLPSLWAATQASMDYRFGFIKRGLFGQVSADLGIPIARYNAFVAVSALLFLLFCLLLAQWIWRSTARRIADGRIVAVFAASFILTFLAHLLGYLEIPAAILALLALSAGTSRWRLALPLGAGAIGALIHESYVLTFLPVTLLPAFLDAASRPRPWRALLPIAIVLVLLAAVVLTVALGASMTPERVAQMQAAMAASVDFHPRGDFFAVLTRSAGANFLTMWTVMSSGPWWMAQLVAFLVYMPTTAFFLWLAFLIVDARDTVIDRRLVKLVLGVTGLCPLALQIMGWDIYRWYALAGFTSFLTLTIVCSRSRSSELERVGDSKAVQNAAILLIGVNLATGTGLFDGYHVDTFPFVDHWRALLQWMLSGGNWPQPAS